MRAAPDILSGAVFCSLGALTAGNVVVKWQTKERLE